MINMADLEKKPKYKLDMEIEIGDKLVSLNNKKSRLLQCIDQCGSIVKASNETGIPYRTALKNIEIMENELGSPIIVTKRGGKGGGGSSKLTPSGEEILHKFMKMNRILKKHVEVNEIEGKISSIDQKEKVMYVTLNKEKIVLSALKGFKVGDTVLILISPIDIFVTLNPQESSVRNMLEGNITEMRFKNDMVRLNVDIDNIPIKADITELSRKKLNLNLGETIFIGFKAVSADIIKI